MTRNLIVTSAFGYRIADIQVFLKSAAVCSPESDVVVIARESDASNLAGALELNANTRVLHVPDRGITGLGENRASQLLRRLLPIAVEKPSRVRTTTIQFHPAVRRFFVAKLLLGDVKQKRKWSNVLLSDSRDVLFQSDPFAAMPRTHSLVYGVESTSIGTCSYNSRWIKEAYSDRVFNDVAHQMIACSGVTIGTTHAIFNYLSLMCHESIVALRCKPDPSRYQWDQAFHNKIVYHDGLKGSVGVPPGGCISTLGYVRDEEIQADPSGLVRVSGRLPAILHQYDRHPKLLGIIKKLYD